MSERRALLILHGKQALNEAVRTAVEQKRQQGWELAVRLTWEAGDAQRWVEQALADGYRTIIAGGGDGTLRDIAEALAAHPGKASLVLLPLGTANDFSRAAGIPLEPAEALELLDVPPRDIDLGEVGGQIFLNMATGGFGSQVTANTSEDLKKVLGGAAYLFTGLSRFSELHAAYGELQGPDFHWSGELLALGIGNGRQAGGGHVLCPAGAGRRRLAGHQHPAGAAGTGGHLEKPAQRRFRDRQYVCPHPFAVGRNQSGRRAVHQSRWRAAGGRQHAVRGATGSVARAFAGALAAVGRRACGQSSRLMICSRTANSTRPATS